MTIHELVRQVVQEVPVTGSEHQVTTATVDMGRLAGQSPPGAFQVAVGTPPIGTE